VQVPLTTARWLARDHGCSAFPAPTQQLLLDPVPNLYYCGSYLQLLSNHQGWPRTEEFVVKAYHAGQRPA
jgi:soluble lytic murein transglycosylase-like protein